MSKAAAVALREAAAELERQAKKLRARADRIDGVAKVAKKKTAKKAAKKRDRRQTDLEKDFLPRAARGGRRGVNRSR